MENDSLPPGLPFDVSSLTAFELGAWLDHQANFGDQDQYPWRDMMRRALIADNVNLHGLAAGLAALRELGAVLDTTGRNPILTRGTLDQTSFWDLSHRWIAPHATVLHDILSQISLPGSPSPAALAPTRPWQDPRPDLNADHHLWDRLLEMAFQHDGQDATGLFATLVELRVVGAHLSMGAQTACLDAGKMDPVKYRETRSDLLKNTELIKVMLRVISQPKKSDR